MSCSCKPSFNFVVIEGAATIAHHRWHPPLYYVTRFIPSLTCLCTGTCFESTTASKPDQHDPAWCREAAHHHCIPESIAGGPASSPDGFAQAHAALQCTRTFCSTCCRNITERRHSFFRRPLPYFPRNHMSLLLSLLCLEAHAATRLSRQQHALQTPARPSARFGKPGCREPHVTAASSRAGRSS
jgi:hypothetical protein